MGAPSHEFKTLIRESHLDTFGHVNNAKYLELFEQARWDIISAGGYGLDKVLATQEGPVVLAVNVRFRRELHLREAITIQSQFIEMGKKVGLLRQTLLNEAGEESAVADFTMGFFDLKKRKLIAPTQAWLDAVGWTGPLSNN